jgi:hypothetical protein
MVGSWRLPNGLNNPLGYEEHVFYAEVDNSGTKAASENVKMVYSADYVEAARITIRRQRTARAVPEIVFP